MSLTKEARDALPESDFAVPGKRKLPIHDKTHVKLAWDMVDRTQGLSGPERTEARTRIMHRAHELGIDTKNWMLHASFALEAMALQFPDGDATHLNKMPFEGILTRVDQPSDYPPHCGDGEANRVYLPKEVAEAALGSLLGMAVDFTPDLDGHDTQAKIGIMTEAWIDGDALRIKGFFYAADFPEVCATIKAEKDRLGFSYEGRFAIQDLDADPWVITQCVFTGAAVLQKNRAAYTTTSLAASAANGDFDMSMTKEELAEILKTATAPLMAKIEAQGAEIKSLAEKSLAAGATLDKVRPHAEALRTCASAMETAGIGTHATMGHVNVLRHMAASMENEANLGNLPHIYRDHDYLSRAMEASAAELKPGADMAKQIGDAVKAAVEPLQTQVADLKAASFKGAQQPERKTLTPEIKDLLAKAGVSEADAAEGKLTVAAVDKVLEAQGVTGARAIEAKMKMMASGVLQSAATH